MIFNGYPIDLRHLHKQLWWQYRYSREVNAKPSNAQLTLLYFSYRPDLEYLRLSLKTLLRSVPLDRVRQIIVAEDQKAPFSETEKSELATLINPVALQIRPIYNFEWGSPESTHAELQLFIDVSRELTNTADLIVKCDSDVLFLPDSEKWSLLLDAPQDAFGDGHFLQYRYAQGGLYFLRKRLIDEVFPGVSIDVLHQIAQSIQSVGEDMAITELCRRGKRPFFFLRMMLFPGEYRQLERLNDKCRSEFMALHCHKDKKSMQQLVTKFEIC